MFDTIVDRKEEQLVLTVSPEMAQELNLKQGDHLQIDVSDRGRRRRRFAPGQLVREHAEIMHELEDNREWIDAPAVGREIL